MALDRLKSVDIEEALLGHLMVYREDFDDVKTIINADTFYKESNADVYKAIETLNNKGVKVDMMSVITYLRDKGLLEKCGGIVKLSNFCDGRNIISDVVYQARGLQERKIKRDLIQMLHDTQKELLSGEDVFTLMNNLSKFNEDTQNSIQNDSTGNEIKDVLGDCINAYTKREELYKSGKIAGIPSCISSLTDLNNGWQGSQLIIIGGRPGMGKTAYALAEAKEMAKNGEYPCFFTLEMSNIKLVDRMIINECHSLYKDLDSDFGKRYKKGKLRREEKACLYTAIESLENSNIYVNDKASCNLSYIKRVCKLRKMKGKCTALFVDYLQLMTPENTSVIREQQIAQISRGLKLISKELDIPVFLLVQLNRNVEERPTKMPIMSDIRESGSIEQDADIILYPFRPRYYINTDSSFEQRMKDAVDNNVDWKNTGLLMVVKDRENGTKNLLIDINESCTNWTAHGEQVNNMEEQAIDFSAGFDDNNPF